MKTLLLAILLLSSFFARAEEKLKSYNVELNSITISGISSGAFMANQMAVAFSKTISGSASIAGGIFWCAEGDSKKAQGLCMNTTGNIKSEVQIAYVRKLATEGAIDPLENFAKQQMYIFASPKDTIIKPPSSDKLYEFAAAFIQPAQIKFEKGFESAHGFPTLNYGSSCAMGFLPWLLKCNFDAAGEVFKTMYPNLQPRGAMEATQLKAFDQSEFGPVTTPLFPKGWIYVPKSCQQGQACKLHVALHGCQMNPDYIQDQFAKNAGYNEWAESNNIIVLYPQSAKLGQVNPYGCWDWFGFTGSNYVTKSGVQMKILKAMIDRITKQD